MIKVKRNFAGGIASQFDPSKANWDTEYFLGINVRARMNALRSVLGPVDHTYNMPGRPQGVYAIGDTLLAFSDGQPFMKNADDTVWRPISAFLDNKADIWIEQIPESLLNFTRAATFSTTQADNEVILNDPIAPSPQCTICCDGISQPIIIFPDGTARITQNYEQWTPENPEYVPIGTFPMYHDGILYLVGKNKDGVFNQILRSVSGRPLDFVILLNKAGNKISSSEAEGGAPVLAHRVSFERITCLQKTNIFQGGFFVSTQYSSYAVAPNYDSTIAAEPTFDNQFLFDTGAINNNSLVDILGDTAIITPSGVRSFNGISQYRFAGKNTPFSMDVNSFVAENQPSTVAAVTFNNYDLFAIQSLYGPALVVFDEILQQFVSLDIYKYEIIQFARMQLPQERLFFRTETGIYEAYVGDPMPAAVFLLDLTPPDMSSHRIVQTYASISNTTKAGYIESVAYSDHIPFLTGSQYVPESNKWLPPVGIPFESPSLIRDSLVYTFTHLNTQNGWRAMAGFAWTSDSTLLEVGVELDVSNNEAIYPTPVRSLAVETTINFIGNDSSDSVERTKLYNYMMNTERATIGLGNHSLDGSQLGIDTFVKPYWDFKHSRHLFTPVMGAQEIGNNLGIDFYAWNHNGRYAIQKFPGVDIFLVTSGFVPNFSDSSTQVEPDNLPRPSVDPEPELTIADSIQMQRLRRDLAESEAEFKIVVWHDCRHTSNATVPLHTTTQLQLIPLKEWGANLLITGGGQMYERWHGDDGLVEVNVGTGSENLYYGPRIKSNNSKFTHQDMGFLQLKVTPVRISGTFISPTGEKIDSFLITKYG